jgi:hypothetical protein
VNVSGSSHTNHRPLPFPDDHGPFSQLRGTIVAHKPIDVPATTQRAGRRVKVAHGVMSTPRARTTTIIAPRLPKQPARKVPSRGQVLRVVPTPTAGSAEKPSHTAAPIRPATVTGRIASTSRIVSIPTTSYIPRRPATSASLRPPSTATRSASMVVAKDQAGATPLEFDNRDLADDFMFGV